MVSTARTAILLFIMSLCCRSLSADAAKDAWKECSKANDAETKRRECSIAIESGTLSKDIVAKALLNRVSAYDELGDYDRAINDLDEFLRLFPSGVKSNPSASQIIDSRGWEYVRKFDYKRAIQDFDQAIQLDPKNDYVYANRGIARFLSGEFANAENDFAMAERLAPQPVRAYAAIKRTLAHLRQGDEKEMKPDLSPAKIEGDLAHWPGQIAAYYAGVITREAVLQAAQVPFEKEQKWKLCQAYFYFGEHALIEGKRGEAMELLQKSLDTEATNDPEYVLAEGELRNLRGLVNSDVQVKSESH